jgi:hypothetical protein
MRVLCIDGPPKAGGALLTPKSEIYQLYEAQPALAAK